MNFQDIVFLDFETTSVSPFRCQPIQLAAIVIDGRKLEIREDSVFNSYIRPIFDEDECKNLDLDPMVPEITTLTGITVETLQEAPSVQAVWEQFAQYVNKFNAKKSKWGAPIKAGMNIWRYDIHIINRLCGGHSQYKSEVTKWLHGSGQITSNIVIKEPYGFGNWDNDRKESTLFYPRDTLDLMEILWLWTENNPEIKSLSMDKIRDWLGVSTEGSHNAVKDVRDGAEILVRLLNLHRKFAPKVKFANSFKGDNKSG